MTELATPEQNARPAKRLNEGDFSRIRVEQRLQSPIALFLLRDFLFLGIGKGGIATKGEKYGRKIKGNYGQNRKPMQSKRFCFPRKRNLRRNGKYLGLRPCRRRT